MKLPAQMLVMVIFLHPFISLASEFEDEDQVADPLHYDYDVSSQTMKKRGRDANVIQLEECRKNLEAEKNIRGIISDALEEVKISKEDCLKNLKSLKDEKRKLENIVQEENIEQQKLKDANSVCESQNQDLKQKTQSLSSNVVELEEELAIWKKLSIVLFTLALGAVIAIAVMCYNFPRIAPPHIDEPDQQDVACQHDPPYQENVPHQQQPAPQEDAAPLQNVEEHQCYDDQHNGEGHQDGFYRHRYLGDPSGQVGGNPPVPEVEERGPLDGERNLGDPSNQVGAIPYQTATRNCENESSLAVPPLDDWQHITV